HVLDQRSAEHRQSTGRIHPSRWQQHETGLPTARSREDISLIKEAALRIFRDATDDENIRRILLEAYESEGQLENARR
ncbi:hypothetical protein ACC772_40145, partial [Rhizobium ruizarguesonis]